MDTLPPVSPPAIVQHVDQAALDAHKRIIAMKTWLTTQHDAMPALSDTPSEADRRGLAFALNLYWSQPVTLDPARSVPRIDAFQAKLASAMMDVAMLRHADGILDDDAYNIVVSFFRQDAAVDSQLSIREITVGDAVYAGAILVADARHPGKTMLFMSDHGWQAFGSDDEARIWIGEHLRQVLRERSDLPGLARQAIEPDAAIESRRIEGHAIKAMSERMVAVQRDKIKLAWFQASLESASDESTKRLADDLNNALALTDFFNVDAILAQGEQLMIEDAAKERLARLPAMRPGRLPLADMWRQADADYFATRKAVDHALRDQGLDHDFPELYDYATIRLQQTLQSLGLTVDPREIIVTWDRSNAIATAVDVLTKWSTTPTARMSLAELACTNVPELHLGRLSATDGKGQPVPQLDNAVLWALVRTIDIGSTYPVAVESSLRSGEEGLQRKQAAMLTQVARMRFEAIEAHVASVLGEYASDQDIALSERGLLWVNSVLDSPTPAGRRRVYDKQVQASRVVYDGSPLQGVVEFSLKDIGWAEPADHMGAVVYYTPQAPDGLEFREYRSREEADRRFFRNSVFMDYLLDRLPADIAEVPEKQKRRRFKAPYGTMWVLNTVPPQGVTPMGGSFSGRPVDGNIIEALYDATIDQVLRDVRVHARATALADDDAAISAIADHVYGIPLAPRIVAATASAPFQAGAAFWRAYDQVKLGHYDKGFVEATDAYVTGMGAMGIAGALRNTATSKANLAKFRTMFRRWERSSPPSPASTPSSGSASPGGLFRVTDRPIVPGNEPRTFDHILLAIDGKVYHVPRQPSTSHFQVTTSRNVRGTEHRAIRQWQRDMRTARRRAERRRLNERDHADTSSADEFAWREAHNVPDRYDRFVEVMKEEFPDRVERRLVIDTALTSQATGLRSLTAAQREGLATARNRLASSASFPSGSSASGTVTPELAVPVGYQRVSLSELPQKLWFYERKALRSDSLVNVSSSGQDLMQLHKARLIGDLQDGGRYGVRLTSADPMLPTEDLAAGAQVTPFTRGHTRAVELDVRSILLGRRPHEVLYDLYERPGSSVRRKHYLLLPRRGRDIELQTREFIVRDNLPPYRGSSGASLSSLDTP